MTTDSSSTKRRVVKVWWAVVAVFVLLVVGFGTVQIVSVHRLRTQAAKVQVGMTQAEVEAMFGSSPAKSRFFVPSGRRMAKVETWSYGGPLNRMRWHVDCWIYSIADSWPRGYEEYIADVPTNWPVKIHFDEKGQVETDENADGS